MNYKNSYINFYVISQKCIDLFVDLLYLFKKIIEINMQLHFPQLALVLGNAEILMNEKILRFSLTNRIGYRRKIAFAI